jgi:hypothetical protein
VSEFRRREAAEAFGDVAGHRSRRAPDLIAESEIPSGRFRGNSCSDVALQIVREPPDQQVFVTLGSSHAAARGIMRAISALEPLNLVNLLNPNLQNLLNANLLNLVHLVNLVKVQREP